jgi:ribosome-associated toxin RatA of RatAB toxin-antitoxin module
MTGRLALAAAVALALAPGVPAAADWSPSAEALARLERGDVHADVMTDPGGADGLVHGAVDIDAPPSVVWSAILDCGRAGRMAPGIRSCRITERDPAGKWDVREMTVQWAPLTPVFRTAFRSEFDPGRRIRFRCVSGDVRFCEGLWRLEPLGRDRTRVIYENRASSPLSAPALVTRAAMRRDVARALKALKRESESRVR